MQDCHEQIVSMLLVLVLQSRGAERGGEDVFESGYAGLKHLEVYSRSWEGRMT
jgi:hypothetical protein